MAQPPVTNTGPNSIGQPNFDVGMQGCVVLPSSSGGPLTIPTRAIVITVAGALTVIFADGTSNAGSPVAVTPGQQFDWAIVSLGAGNTAGALGLR